MADKETIHNQNLNDLKQAVVVLLEILETKELNGHDEKRLQYGTKLIKNVTEKIKEQ